MVTIQDNEQSGNLISAKVQGDLTSEDYKKLNPLIETKIRENGDINMLFEFENFDNINFGSVWQELKFDSKHSDDVNRIAIVGDRDMEQNLEQIKDSFISADTKYFDRSHRDEALMWV